MELAFTEHKPEFGIIGLKKTAYIEAIKKHDKEHLWIARLLSKSGIFAGYFCMFSTDEHEYHLQNDKGTVRIFKTVESASAFYSAIRFDNSSVLTHVYLGLV